MNNSTQVPSARLSVGLAARTFLICAGAVFWETHSPFCAAAAAAEANSRVYFVDSTTGSDEADGQSPERAWRSLERVNQADLHPGDEVRFKRGGVWRGVLEPVSGADNAPVAYTSYGEGAKPLLLGSAPRNRLEDWTKVEDHLWATLPASLVKGEQLLELRQSDWRLHQEGGAQATLHLEEADAGRTIRIACDNSGTASNHVQLWGPSLPVRQGACLALTFRARCSIPCSAPPIFLRRNGPPWSVFAEADMADEDIGSEWRAFEALFSVSGSSEAAYIHLCLGAVMPAGGVFELQPLALHAVASDVSDPLSVDVGNIIFDHGKICGWKKWSVDDLQQDYDYYYDGPTQRVYLHCPDNPAALHESVECALKRHVVNQSGAHHVVYDGLAVKYGAAHGFGGGNTRNLVIRNCDLAYIGGGHQLTRDDGVPVRFGNAIEFWGAASGHLVEGCRIWEVYDAALTNQSRGDGIRQENILYRNNIIWNCEYSFEYWNNPETATTANIRFVNNTCVNAGTVWSHEQRPDRNGSHLMFYTNKANTSGFEVKYNLFYRATDWGCRYSSGWETLPEMDCNLWFSDTGVMAYWFKDMLKDFQNYQATTGLDQHSIFADPAFLDPLRGDFRLSSESPARRIRPDGGPVGAESLWE